MSEETELRGAPGPTLRPAFTLGSGSFPPIVALNDFSFPLSITIVIMLLKYVLLCMKNNNGFPNGSVVKNPPANASDTGDTGALPGSGRSLGGGNGNPLQYSCLRNPMDRGAWWVTVHELERVGHNLETHAHDNNSQSLLRSTKCLHTSRNSPNDSVGRWYFYYVHFPDMETEV